MLTDKKKDNKACWKSLEDQYKKYTQWDENLDSPMKQETPWMKTMDSTKN